MNTATVLHRTAMEFYDLAYIYRAKGETASFDDYRYRAWLLAYEAALQVLREQEDFTFKYLVIGSAGKLGYEVGDYVLARNVVELGLMKAPKEFQHIELKNLLKALNREVHVDESEDKDTEVLSGVLTAVDIEQGRMSIRETESSQMKTIDVPIDMIKNVIRYYLGELISVQLHATKEGEILRLRKVK